MSYDSERLIPKILDMYYTQEMSQDAIARKLGVSRATVARNLTRAKELGYVKITINYPDEKTLLLEKSLKEKYALQDVCIAGHENAQNNIFTQAAGYLARLLRNDMTLGLTWGTSVKQVIDCLPQQLGSRPRDYSNIKIVPLIGAVTAINMNDPEKRLTSSNHLAIRAGEILEAISYNLSAPLFVSDPDVKAMLEREQPIAEVLHLAKRSDVVLLGIGTVDSSSTLGKAGGYSPAEYAQFRQNGAAGEIVGRMYREDGACVDAAYGDHIIGIALSDIKSIPVRIAVAFGSEKISAIKGALRGRIVNVLITDQETARQL